jgi:endonuclease YncB( thermonuclease family)
MIRLRGVNAPEKRKRGAAARDFLAGLIPSGTRCRIATERYVTTFGRCVANELEDGRDMDAALIEAGHADVISSRATG